MSFVSEAVMDPYSEETKAAMRTLIEVERAKVRANLPGIPDLYVDQATTSALVQALLHEMIVCSESGDGRGERAVNSLVAIGSAIGAHHAPMKHHMLLAGLEAVFLGATQVHGKLHPLDGVETGKPQ